MFSEIKTDAKFKFRFAYTYIILFNHFEPTLLSIIEQNITKLSEFPEASFDIKTKDSDQCCRILVKNQNILELLSWKSDTVNETFQISSFVLLEFCWVNCSYILFSMHNWILTSITFRLHKIHSYYARKRIWGQSCGKIQRSILRQVKNETIDATPLRNNSA